MVRSARMFTNTENEVIGRGDGVLCPIKLTAHEQSLGYGRWLLSSLPKDEPHILHKPSAASSLLEYLFASGALPCGHEYQETFYQLAHLHIYIVGKVLRPPKLYGM